MSFDRKATFASEFPGWLWMGLSMLMHAAVLFGFIACFPIAKENIRPEFVFLGPILKDSDVDAPWRVRDALGGAGERMNYDPALPVPKSLKGMSPQKPKNARGKNKATPKTLFYPPLTRTKQKTAQESVDKDGSYERFYKPLSIYSDDQN